MCVTLCSHTDAHNVNTMLTDRIVKRAVGDDDRHGSAGIPEKLDHWEKSVVMYFLYMCL